MNFKQTLLAGAVAVSLGFVSSGAYALQEGEPNAEAQARAEARAAQRSFAERQRQTDNIDVGFRIPSPDEVERARDSRRNQAASEQVGRRIMQAFELYEEEDIPGAINILEGINTRTEYDTAYVNRFLGNLYAAGERAQDAINRLEQAIAPDILGFNDQEAAMLLVANLHLQEENFQQAVENYRRWIQFTGRMDPDVFVRMANAHMQMENYAQVVPLARKARHYQMEPNRNPYILQFASLYELQRMDESIEVLEEAVQAIPTEERWWAQLGMLYFQQERSDEALATMDLAYRAGFLSQQNDFRALAQMFSNNMIPYRAAEVLRRHLESDDIDKTARNYSIAASAYHSAREFEQANEMYVLAAENAESREDRHDYHRRRGNSLLLADNYAEAARAFNAALETAESDDDGLGRVYMSLAEAYFYTERYTDAVRAAERAARYSDQRRNAESWANYIRETAERRGVDI
ncbi:tetratricopeptide repeat protein [Aliidiomarina soli]|uniref:Uncharacterized protein n=1 Tax=Aliidiomarina soli TaxID=1928574 RepID=A0A432WGW7_9GAMM|nr:hypothetical protein [Aliidiomarina soli]RUO33003.1 hypothetical protein CWE14_07095 [Aliidiomarina soli]